MQKSILRLLSIADFVSICSAIFGIFAIIVLFSDCVESFDIRLRFSFSLILFALLADGLDGIVARKFGKSEIGEYLDSMADTISLVIAPAIFVYIVYYSDISDSYYRVIYLFVALVLFLFFGIIRLASFHIMKKDKIFVGLPSPASTILLIVLAYFKIEFIFILPAVVIIGAAMASDINFPKPGLKMDVIAALLIVLTLIFDKTYYGFAPILLFVALLLYSVGGPIYMRFLTKKL